MICLCYFATWKLPKLHERLSARTLRAQFRLYIHIQVEILHYITVLTSYIIGFSRNATRIMAMMMAQKSAVDMTHLTVSSVSIIV